MADDTKVVPKPEAKKMATTKVQQALDALAKIENLKQEAIQELLDERRKIDEQLSQLGYETATPAKKTVAKRTADPDKPCSICGWATTPNHDGRQHRNQDPKKPFTAKELADMGMTKKA